MKKKKQTLLWRIESGKKVKPSYVFGTMHVRDQRAFKYKDLVEEKILECASFAAEINLEKAEITFTANSMNLPDNQTLSNLFKPKIYKKIDKLFRKIMGLPLSYFEHSQPLLISNILTEKLLSADMPLSLDATLNHFATQNEKIILGIETMEEQIEILSKISLDHQVKSLTWMAKNFKQFRKQLMKMTADYENGNIQKLYQTTKKQTKGLRKILLYNRNKIMAERIGLMAKEQSIFAAIGASHLGGQKGVLRFLKKNGFKVKPVRLN